jgi:hypothetical protein
MKKFTQPEIFYEESAEGFTNGMPFMQIENDQSVPNALFMGAAKNIKNKNSEVDKEDMCEITMQMYVNSEVLKAVLNKEDYDKIRVSIGLDPLNVALEKSIKK